MLNEIQRKAKDEATMFFRGFTASATGPNTTNIVGWGIGAKVIDELVRPDENVLRVYVRELPAPAVPEQFGDLPTEVVAVGKITAYQSAEQHPVPCGVSVGHPNIRSGTLGCLVEKDGNHYILSNNHVLADSNNATPGDPVIQPGRADGGTSPDDDIAILEPYRAIDLVENPDHIDPENPNYIDAAIARVGDVNQTRVRSEIIDIGIPGSIPVPVSNDLINQVVQKYGRTTGHTIGTVVDFNADFNIYYENGNYARFANQIGVRGVDGIPFSAPGDSGSLIVDRQNRAPVALLFAGSDFANLTLANPIHMVLDNYDVTIVSEGGIDT